MRKQMNKKILPLLVTCVGLVSVVHLPAQTFKNLHNFSYNATDGANPAGGVTVSGNVLYGSTFNGGGNSAGSLFQMNTDSTGFSLLYSFSPPDSTTWVNTDGSEPYSPLVLSGGVLYGSAQTGGSSGSGVAFSFPVRGPVPTILNNFINFPSGNRYVQFYAALVLTNNTLYGTMANGGTKGYGTVFKVNPGGTGFITLHNFTNGVDGATPLSGLVAGGSFYGVALGGGSAGNGTIFRVNTDGSGFTNLHTFPATLGTLRTNADGAGPDSLVISGSALYGTANFGGRFGSGTVFAINTNGTGFTNLYTFSAAPGNGLYDTNLDGASPQAGMVISGNALYGSTFTGGTGGTGTIFRINTDGTGISNLHSFSGPSPQGTNSDGIEPVAGVTLSGNKLYGITAGGGTNGTGTVFSLSFSPTLTISNSSANVILSWPSNSFGLDFSGFTLQSTTNPGSATNWSTVSTTPAVVNGQFTVTNPVSGAKQFFRLIE